MTAYYSCGNSQNDGEHGNGTTQGAFFMRFPTKAEVGGGAPAPSLLVTYLGKGTVEASASLYDIDGTSLTNTEQFRILAFDGNRNEIGRVLTPLGNEDSCNGHSANNYDALPWYGPGSPGAQPPSPPPVPRAVSSKIEVFETFCFDIVIT